MANVKQDTELRLSLCKFCGGRASLLLTPEGPVPRDHKPMPTMHHVACDDCGCRTADFVDPYLAVGAWNRTPEKTGETTT